MITKETFTNIVLHNDYQKSDAWFEKRHQCLITGSVVKSLMTAKTMKPVKGETIETFAKEKAIEHFKTYQDLEQISLEETGKSTEIKTFDVERGHKLEPEARRFYEKCYNIDIKEVGFYTTQCGLFGYSPDGLIGDDGLIEIKARRMINHCNQYIDCLVNNEAPYEYYAQLQWGLLMTGRKWIDLIMYNEYVKSYLIRVTPNEEYIDNLLIALNNLVEKYKKYKEQLSTLFN